MEQLDPARLLSLEQSIVAGDFEPPDALLIARGGRLVYEQYWNGFDRARLHDLRSATKSVTSLLVGIARDPDGPTIPRTPPTGPEENAKRVVPWPDVPTRPRA